MQSWKLESTRGSSSWTWACPELLGCTELLGWQDRVRRNSGEEAPSHFQNYRSCPLASNPSQKCFRRTCCDQLLVSPICHSSFLILLPSQHISCPIHVLTHYFLCFSLTGHQDPRQPQKLLQKGLRQTRKWRSTDGQDKCLDRYHPKCLVSTEVEKLYSGDTGNRQLNAIMSMARAFGHSGAGIHIHPS